MKFSVVEKLWQLLTPAERRGAIALLGLMALGMLFETLGVGLVIPALALMSRADLVVRYPALGPWITRLGNPSPAALVVGGMLTLVVVYLVKTTFLGFLQYQQMRYVYELQAQISQRLFAAYLRQPYTFHIQRNSAQLISNAMGEVNILTQNGVLQLLILLTEVLVVIGVFTLLMYIEPLGAFLAGGTLALAIWGCYRFTRRRILRWGEARQVHESMRIQHLQQGFGGVKDIKVLGREAEFVARYQEHTEASARVGEKSHTMQQLPRLALELLTVIALAVLVIVMIGQGRPMDTLLPTIGLFAAAAFRVMPSANRLVNAIQVMRYALPVVNTLHEEMLELETPAAGPARGAPLRFERGITLQNVEFRYPTADVAALRGVSLTITAGSSAGFIGGSGAGKSTLVDVILGLLTPQHGTVCVDGADIQFNLRGWQDSIGYVPQHIYLADDTLRRNIAFGLPDEQIDESSVQRAVRAAQLHEFVKELPLGLETKVGERGVRLSGGQLQRIGIARALYHDPPVLVLDEATSALDTATEREVMAAVRAFRGRKTVIIVAHRLSTVEHCDCLCRLDGGQVVEVGEPAHMLAPVAATRP